MSNFIENLCGSPLWNLDLNWNTPNPYLTPCFEESFLSWTPCAFLWLFSPMDIYYSLRSLYKNVPYSPLNVSKLVATLLLGLLQLFLLVKLTAFRGESEIVHAIYLVTPLVKLMSYLLVIALLLFSLKKGVRSSGVQFVFWFLILCTEAIRFRTTLSRINKNVPTSFFMVNILSFGLIVANFCFSLFADVAPSYKHPLVTTSSKSTLTSGKTCPEERSSYVSRILFHWYNGLAIKGYRKPLEYTDLWELNPEDTSRALVPQYLKVWEEHVRKRTKNSSQNRRLDESSRSKSASYSKLNGIEDVRGKRESEESDDEKNYISILPVLLKVFGGTFFFGAALKVIPDLLVFVSPQILDLLISFVSVKSGGVVEGNEEGGGDYVWKGYFYAFLLFGSAFIQTLLTAQYAHRMYMTGMRVRTVLVAAIYRKALLVSNAAKRASTLGEIVNLMSVDVQKIMDNIPFVNMLWSAPLQIGVAMYFLWGILGPSVLSGLAVIILLIPANAVIAGRARKLQVIQMKFKDERVKLINEILSGVKVLKLYAWEPSFKSQILAIRQKELKVLKDAAILNAGTTFLWTCAPFLVALSTFATYVLLDEKNILDAQKAFVSMSLLNVINLSVTFLPMIIIFSVQAAVSTKRITKFLNAEEIDRTAVTHDAFEDDPIVVEDGSFAWESSVPVLSDINLKIPEGSLVAIVGTVGSGKSSLLLAMLGELEKLKGRVNTKGSIGYVAQQAWIQNATLRDNVVFGAKFEGGKYDKVIEACALKQDLEILPGGDMTEIGEKGINLSGGQKQRVSLARAVYNNSDMYLFDDPLSAVDSHVGKHIFEKVIGPQGCLKRKTRVLVTHGIAFLPQMDQIIVVKDGRISETGTYQELLDKKGSFAEFLTAHLTSEDISEIEDSNLIEGLRGVVGSLELIRQRSRTEGEGDNLNNSFIKRTISSSSLLSDAGSDVRRKLSRATEETLKRTLIEVEKSETESVKVGVYYDYFKAAGWGMLLSMLLLFVLFQGFSIGSSLWLSKWADEPVVNGTQDGGTRDLYLSVYGGLGLLQSVAILGASILMAIATLKSAAVLHTTMLSRILRAPMSFFDTTPVGRIVNRFAKDVDICDNTLPFMIRLWLNSFLQVASTLIIISYTTPIFISVIIPIGIVYYFVQRIYVSSSRQMKRLESVTRSPIYSHFGETVAGAATIRAYGQEERFISDSESKVDHNQAAYYPAVTANRWLAIRLETVGNTVILFAAIFAVLAREELEPGLVGLSISYALQITIALNMLVRWTSDLETNIVSVERVKEYTLTPMEADWTIEETKPPNSWPERGEVEFINYQTRYRAGLDLVLRDLSCKINPSEKIGIVGRTGAGKSSMTLALFRIVEAAGGSIFIDGRNISKLGLHELRGRLTIIPQDPVLFSGTLRNNLDPFEAHEDSEIWRVLELAHLKSFASSLPSQLLHEISESGDNLSVGQRQLVCLARALLRKTKILILDEATAAVDLETDDLIQRTIRTEFNDCTVITIAHRLNTIMDSTRVLVLDKGEIREFDSPTNLMRNKNSLFYGMAKDAGITSIEQTIKN